MDQTQKRGKKTTTQGTAVISVYVNNTVFPDDCRAIILFYFIVFW